MSTRHGDGRFPTTHWTLIARIKSDDPAVAAKALDEICAHYHYPLYCYLRRRGCAHHDAQDVLQDFLASLLRRRALERLEEARGRLRGYLSTALGRHLGEWRQGEARRGRGVPSAQDAAHPPGDAAHGAPDFEAAGDRYQRERFTDEDTPERVFERKWACELLGRVLEKVGASYERRRKGALFAALRPALERGGTLRGEDSQALAERLGMSATAVRSALARLLKEFRETLHDEVRPTVQDSAAVADELAHLLSLFQ